MTSREAKRRVPKSELRHEDAQKEREKGAKTVGASQGQVSASETGPKKQAGRIHWNMSATGDNKHRRPRSGELVVYRVTKEVHAPSHVLDMPEWDSGPVCSVICTLSFH